MFEKLFDIATVLVPFGIIIVAIIIFEKNQNKKD